MSRSDTTPSIAGSRTPVLRRELAFLAGASGIVIILLGYYVLTWNSYSGFAGSIDTCGGVFCDFVRFYYPMGEVIFRTRLPVQGYVYSPFNAILMSVFPLLGIANSVVLWGVLQALAIISYIVLFRHLVPASLHVQLLFVAIVASSFTILHNISWGQVGLFTTVAILGSLALYHGQRSAAAAGALAFAASSKFFPLIFLAPLAFRRDTRSVLLSVRACVGCLLVVPVLILGSADTFRFYDELLHAYRDMGWVVTNYNSQHLPHVVLRLASAAQHDWLGYLPLLQVGSYAIAAVNLAVAYVVHHRRVPYAHLLSCHLLFLTIPFLLTTSWPADLSFLPFAEGLLAWRVLPRGGRPDSGNAPTPAAGEAEVPSPAWQLRRGAAILLLVLSIAISNVVFFNLLGDRVGYGFLGIQFWQHSSC